MDYQRLIAESVHCGQSDVILKVIHDNDSEYREH